MKKLTVIIFVLFSINVGAQKLITPTNEFFATGAVKSEQKFSSADIEKIVSVNIPDLIISNHKGEPRDTLRNLKGFLMKNLLKDVALKEDNPKLYSEFYFTFIASDNYKVVYSWNEIFNTPTGDNLYIVTSINGDSFEKMKNRILVVTPTDYRTGRRYIKCLSKIVASRTD